MWRLLKAELSYNKNLLVATIIITLLFLVAGELGAINLEAMSWLPFLGVAILFINQAKNKVWERLHALLPVALTKVGLVRISFLYLVYFIIAVFWAPWLLREYDISQDITPWYLFGANSVFLTASAIALVYHDLCRGGLKNYRKLFWILVIGYLVLLGFLMALLGIYEDVAIYEGRDRVPFLVPWIMDLPIIPALCILPIPFLFYASIAVYSRRKSYL